MPRRGPEAGALISAIFMVRVRTLVHARFNRGKKFGLYLVEQGHDVGEVNPAIAV